MDDGHRHRIAQKARAFIADDSVTWKLIHAERAALADMLEELTPEQWPAPSLCTVGSKKRIHQRLPVAVD